MISFQQVQLAKENERVEGWRNLAYVDQEYAGKSGKVIDSKGVLREGLYSEIIYEDIGQWFEENGVNYERTCTGVNMLSNILAYIMVKGFLPFSKNEKIIFLEKFDGHEVDRLALSKSYKLYCQNKQRTEHKNKAEITEEIQSTPEFANLAEEQKQGLVQCFLKEEEKEFEIPEEKMQMLNEFIQKNLDNRKNSTDYDLLYKISGMMTRNLKVANRNFGEITNPSTEEQTKKVALEFFKGLDEDLYERAKNIIEGNSDIDFNMYKLDKNDDFSIQKDDGMPVHTKTPCVISKDGKSSVYVPYKGTVEDIYLLVHELSHTFDLTPNDNPTRNLLGEVTPYCFETMLSQYLVENGIATREDAINRKKGNIISHYDDGVETFLKLELMKMKEQKGEIKQEDIMAMQKKYGLTNRQMGYVFGRLGQSEPNVDYRARYMMAQIVYPHYMEQYKQNPSIAIENLKEYFEFVKDNNFKGSLEKLGIQPSLEAVPKLIETCNRRINSLYQPELFSENEIGKSILNIPTIKKDECKNKVQTEEKAVEATKEIKRY